MARAIVDKCGVHAATILLQRLVHPFLDYDLQARAGKHVATEQVRVHDAVFQSLAAIARRELGPKQQSQITLQADVGGCAIRSRNRKGAGVAARWAALSDTLPRSQRAIESLGYLGCWKQAWHMNLMMSPMRCAIWELLSATACLLLTHACTMSSLPVPPAQLAHYNVTLAPSLMNHERSRLQGKAGKATDIVTLNRFWMQVPALACSGATVHVTSVADGCRTITFSKPFSTDSACRESRREASAH